MVDGPVGSFEFFVAGDATWFEYGLGIRSSGLPFFGVMPIRQGVLLG